MHEELVFTAVFALVVYTCVNSLESALPKGEQSHYKIYNLHRVFVSATPKR